MTMLNDNEYAKHERINGMVYTMPRAEGFRHDMVNLNILYAIRSKLKEEGTVVSSGKYALRLSDEDYAMPDIMVLNQKECMSEKWYQGVPCFIAETITEETELKDKTVKKDVYAKRGVAEYWIIDPEEKSCEIYHLEDGVYALKTVFKETNGETPQAIWKGSVILKMFPKISITYQEIFEDVDV